MKANYNPEEPENRLAIIDFLRGFALLGILMVNLPLMNAPLTTELGEYMLWTDPINSAFSKFIKFFFTSKFYPLFSILFGIGFYFFLKKFDEIKKPILPIFRMRLAWLILFGILHIVLLWFGDILLVYGITGFVLILFRKKQNKTLLKWAIGLLITPIVLLAMLVALIKAGMSDPATAEALQSGFDVSAAMIAELTRNALEVYPSGSFTEIMNMRFQEYEIMLSSLFVFFPNVLAYFLIGVVLGKKRVFANIDENQGFFKKILYICLPVAIPLNLLFVYSTQHVSYAELNSNMLLYIATSTFGGISLALAYISVFALIFNRISKSNLTKAISNTGRMALTNYLLQSIICTTLFFSYGFGLYGKVNIWQGIIIVLAVYTIEVIWSHYWLKHYRFGPIEWLWRSLSYRKFQKMK